MFRLEMYQRESRVCRVSMDTILFLEIIMPFDIHTHTGRRAAETACETYSPFRLHAQRT
jgi:hypothetical protein